MKATNNDGGESFVISDMARFRRYLVLGSAGGSYYVSPQKLRVDNLRCVQRLLDTRAQEVVDEIVAVSVGGRAPKQGPGLAALALCCGHEVAAPLAFARVGEVCRTASTFFEWLECMKELGGISWGRACRRAVLRWYTSRTPRDLAYQVTKYQSRNGWSHRDVLRLVHAKPARHEGLAEVFEYAVKGEARADMSGEAGELLRAVQTAKGTTDIEELLGVVEGHGSVSWEHVGDTKLLKEPRLWGALLRGGGLPTGALVRNLVRMARNGALADQEVASLVESRLRDGAALEKARVHPVSVLQAQKMLSEVAGPRSVQVALDEAFVLAFRSLPPPTEQRLLVAVDVSASMGWTKCGGSSCLSARDAAGAVALMLAKTESRLKTVAFTTELLPLSITALDNLASVRATMSGLPFGGTDCAEPMQMARRTGMMVDCFMVLTDSETNAGTDPHGALVAYRREVNPRAKLAVLAFAGTEFSIADPDDAGMLDIAGFDASVPQVLHSFLTNYAEDTEDAGAAGGYAQSAF